MASGPAFDVALGETVTEYSFYSWRGEMVIARLDDLAKIYMGVYAEPPYNSGPLWSADAFAARTRRQVTREGFSFICALSGDELMGFVFGLTFEEGKWWAGDATAPPAEILQSKKFAVIELVVRQEWRGRGVGRALLGRLLTGRPEGYAILSAVPEAPAREMYRRWGWQQVGTAHHAPTAPIMDALALPLQADCPA